MSRANSNFRGDWTIVAIIVLTFTANLSAGDGPLVEKYLHSGEFAKGEQALEAALAAAPKDDQIRFGLGVLQFIRGVERLGQSLHKHGVKFEDMLFQFLFTKSNPAAINEAAWRRILDAFVRDLSAAEATLAGVTDDRVKLPLRLGDIRLDLDGDGKATDMFVAVLKEVMQRQQFDFLASNPDFLVGFDRGDAAWLRAYCHVLMGSLDFYLAFDTERLRNNLETVFTQRARLGQFRKHLIEVAVLNRETWKHIRAETDDDHEWLPNPTQKGVLGPPVRDEMIDTWLAGMEELNAVLDGKRAFLKWFIFRDLAKDGKGLNLKTLFDDPPANFLGDAKFPQNLPDKYWSNAKEIDMEVFSIMNQVLVNPIAVASPPFPPEPVPQAARSVEPRRTVSRPAGPLMRCIWRLFGQ